MYHIKHDKRVYKSANLICDGLAEMLKVKSYDEISITDVCNINGIATRKKESQLIQNIEVEMNKHDLMYCTPILNQIAFVALEIWVENGCKESAEELYSILKRELKIISENM